MLFGMGFALVARERIRADGPFATPAFPLVALHAALVAPIVLYFYAVHPAWSWLYWVDPHALSGAAVLPLMVGHSALVIGGWYGAAVLLRRGMQRPVLYAAASLLGVLFVALIFASHRLATAADFVGFSAHQGTSVFSVQLGWAFVVALLALLASAIYVVIEVGRDSRRVRAR